MKVLAVGGGSGGHVVPVVAVFKQLIKYNKNIKLFFWCDKKFLPQATKIMNSEFNNSVEISSIYSGKLRRYHHLSLLQHFTVPGVVFGNTVDLFKNIFGLFQSLGKLIYNRPDVVFCKGGFVCVPVGIAAWVLRIPVVIHDSDAHPGLANRILSRFAVKIATGAPLKFYSYPKNKTCYAGIPVDEKFKIYSDSERRRFKTELGFNPKKPLVVVTGGGLGAQRLNNTIVHEAEKLARKYQILLVSGAGQYNEIYRKTVDFPENFYLKGFISQDMWKYLAAADLVVARAGATSNLELASLAKPTILVPNGRLTGGHQLKNAEVYRQSNAVEIIDDESIEDSPEELSAKISELLNNPKKTTALGAEFNKFSKPRAAKIVASMILSASKK